MLIVDHTFMNSVIYTQHNNFGAFTSVCLIKVEAAYDDMRLHGTSPITSDILWYQLIRHR